MRRYIDEGRCDHNALKLLSAYFRGAVFDRYHALEAKGEGEMFYIFNTSMDTTELTRVSVHKVFEHDIHGGGHGGWGSHARMLIFQTDLLFMLHKIVKHEKYGYRNGKTIESHV